MYKFRKLIGKYDFPYHFKKIFVRYKRLVMTLMFCDRLHAWLLSGGFLLLRFFSVAISVIPLFYLRFNFNFYVYKIMHL